VPAKPSRNSLPAAEVQEFRRLLNLALNSKDQNNPPRKWADATWGVYAFYDYDGEPIYVGQTKESLRTRIRRHLTNQRTDAVAMRILDIFEVAEIEMWPLWHLAGMSASETQAALNVAEYSAYLQAIERSRFKAILNEKIPPISAPITLPDSFRAPLISDETRTLRGHPDVRISRRAETISRLAAVAYERGEVSDGLRRVLVIQAIRLAYIAALRLAFVEGRSAPDPSAIDTESLIGTVLYEPSDPTGETDLDDEGVADEG
jgi:hypothetical protein